MIRTFNNHENAVSPIVGVMLMLVVTIIIAAVVSAFAGGISAGTEKAPVASFECHISNSGSWGTSGFDLAVISTDNAIPTKDLKLVTTWTNNSGYPIVTTITGQSVIPNTYYKCGSVTDPIKCENNYTSPLGFGPGVNRTVVSGSYYTDQHWGNYSLLSGTHLHNSAAGFSKTIGGYGSTPDSRYQYTTGSYTLGPGEFGTDAMQAILGKGWEELRPGKVVNVQLIHIPSSKVIFDKDVTVEDA
ncbi:type IV pilin N-terminal domain-containing protein [Methanoregula sp.]|uniref:type IV pilin N-terminal domain-containing protein n=1 Tax=Methanoregula sp. TaxID=2052170 RepID=UPI0023738A12|nr:type IV pilin N-terminal domain-containing protein [Methanoregula sp.]MDD1685804.1 type IV pilin N-terminal domain-containing protein [Methanoregula sp.]